MATSRSELQDQNQLGLISKKDVQVNGKVRDPKLDVYDKYYENTQYDHLKNWEKANEADDYVQVRKRKPRIMVGFAKLLASRIAAKLIGDNVFPKLKIEEDPDTEEFFRLVVQVSKLKARIIDPMKRMSVSGSVLVRFRIEPTCVHLEHYNAKYVYPVFQANGELESAKIQYVYPDKLDLDDRGAPKQKWFRMDLGMASDILFDNPEYKEQVTPIFNVVEQVDHSLGFVQAEWFRTSVVHDSVDGDSLVGDILGFIDELNYNLSQSSQAISFNQDPQLTFSGMDEEDVNVLIRSSTKGWNLGKEGKAEFLETSMDGVKTASDFRDKIRLNIQDLARVILLDPEKMVAHAQSGKAMEILHGPLVELINELRPFVEERLIALTQKIGLTILILNRQGHPTPITIPQGYTPKAFNLTAAWPPIFPMTVTDLKDRVAWVSSATSSNLISRETGTKMLAKDFGVENVDEELQKIAAQPILNPFGGF